MLCEKGGINIRFEKYKSLKVSEEFFEKLEEKLETYSFQNIFYETFNNDKEQGYVLKIFDDDSDLFIWACSEPMEEDIMILLGDKLNCDIYNMYNENIRNKVKYFKKDDYDSAVNYVYKQIKYIFRNSMTKEHHFKFDINKSISDIRKIKETAKYLTYEDCYELASFYDEVEKYSCDLIVWDGSLRYRFNKHNGDDLKHLTIKDANPNLQSEVLLMLDMKSELNKFIESELSYEIEYDTNEINI